MPDAGATNIYYQDNGVFLDVINAGAPFRSRSFKEEAMATNVVVLTPEQFEEVDLELLGVVDNELIFDEHTSTTKWKMSSEEESLSIENATSVSMNTTTPISNTSPESQTTRY